MTDPQTFKKAAAKAFFLHVIMEWHCLHKFIVTLRFSLTTKLLLSLKYVFWKKILFWLFPQQQPYANTIF